MKTSLKQYLSRVKPFEDPKISLEQYMTPPALAADLVHTAYMQGDIEGRKVADLGTGTGILGIGAAISGGEVTAVDKDSEALSVAKENADELEVEGIEFLEKDVRDLDEEFDTVVMNPPFSVHSEEGELFLRKAFELSGAVYAIVKEGFETRIKDLVENSNHRILGVEQYTISLPPSYGFHTEESHEIKVNLVITGEE